MKVIYQVQEDKYKLQSLTFQIPRLTNWSLKENFPRKLTIKRLCLNNNAISYKIIKKFKDLNKKVPAKLEIRNQKSKKIYKKHWMNQS